MVDIEKYISLSNEVFKKIDKDQLIKAIDLIKLKINTNKKIITCGNGGSALTASHYITDWNKAYNIETGNTHVRAWSNGFMVANHFTDIFNNSVSRFTPVIRLLSCGLLRRICCIVHMPSASPLKITK